MAARSIWSGSLSFGLVNIPIKLYSAVGHREGVGFHLIHEKCGTRIQYKRWCSHCNEEVPWDKIEKALPLSNGEYFVITKESLEELKPEKSDIIEVFEFVDSETIPQIYLDDHYYALPSTKTQPKAFFLFITALEELKKTAIARLIMKEKEHICAISNYKKGLLLTTLNYEYEIKQLKELEEITAPKLQKKEIELAQELINRLSAQFDMSKFKDTFAERLKKRISEIQKGVTPKKTVKKPAVKPEASLIEALKASLGQNRKPAVAEARKR